MVLTKQHTALSPPELTRPSRILMLGHLPDGEKLCVDHDVGTASKEAGSVIVIVMPLPRGKKQSSSSSFRLNIKSGFLLRIAFVGCSSTSSHQIHIHQHPHSIPSFIVCSVAPSPTDQVIVLTLSIWAISPPFSLPAPPTKSRHTPLQASDSVSISKQCLPHNLDISLVNSSKVTRPPEHFVSYSATPETTGEKSRL